MFCIKIHEKFGVKILAVCDENVLDKEFEYNNIKFKVSRYFYFEKIVNKDEFLKILKEQTFNLINAFGNKTVDLLTKEGFINEKNILIIDGQKHAILQIL